MPAAKFIKTQPKPGATGRVPWKGGTKALSWRVGIGTRTREDKEWQAECLACTWLYFLYTTMKTISYLKTDETKHRLSGKAPPGLSLHCCWYPVLFTVLPNGGSGCATRYSNGPIRKAQLSHYLSRTKVMKTWLLLLVRVIG